MKKRPNLTIIFAVLCAVLPFLTQAAAIKVGQQLTPLAIKTEGEIVLQGDTISHKEWSSDSMRGKVQVFQYMAARMGMDKIHKPFIDAVTLASFPVDKFAVTTLINVDDAMWGTSGLISSELERNKKKHPKAVMVVDKKGTGLKLWNLQSKTSAIVILDGAGKVLFFKEGTLTDKDIEANLVLIEQSL
jgi:YtfJ family uncharacterized protein